MSKEDISKIKIIYDINKKNEVNGKFGDYEEEEEYEEHEENINIFGGEFVKNNKNKCKMIIDHKEYEITEKYNIENYNNNKLEIELKGIDNVTNASNMFSGCSSLSSLPDISKWNTNNVTNMSYMFNGCSSLSFLSDISKWNTKDVTNI